MTPSNKCLTCGALLHNGICNVCPARASNLDTTVFPSIALDIALDVLTDISSSSTDTSSSSNFGGGGDFSGGGGGSDF